MTYCNFSSIADDIVMEILSFLPALDVVRCRKVCQQLNRCSKELSVWLNVFKRCTCALPSVSLESVARIELEDLLVRAEVMDQKWAGLRSNLPAVYNLPAVGLDLSCIGTIGKYVILGRVGPAQKCFWYHRDNIDIDRPVFTFIPPIDQFYHAVYSDMCIEQDKNTLRVVVVQEHDRTGETKLKVMSIREQGGTISDYLDQTVSLPKDLVTEFLEGADAKAIIKGTYVVLIRLLGRATRTRRLVLIHIETGKIVLSPLHARYDPTASQMSLEAFGTRVGIFITPTYLIQVLDGRDFEFFELPQPSELLSTESPIHAKRTTYSLSFPQFLSQIYIFPRSAISFAIVGLSDNPEDESLRPYPASHRLTLSMIRLSEDSTDPAGARIERQCSCDITGRINVILLSGSCSSLSTSALGVMTLDGPYSFPPAVATSNSHRGWRFKAIRAVFGDESRRPELSVTNLNTPMAQLASDQMSFRSFDPYNGQLVLQCTNFRLLGDFGRKLYLLDYLSDRTSDQQ